MPDSINPPHYQGAVECIEAIESLGLGQDYCRGNAIKYLWRLGKKGEPLEDARKAKWYIERLILQLETEAPTQQSEETMSMNIPTIDGDWQPLTDDTPRGTYWWCKGDGTQSHVIRWEPRGDTSWALVIYTFGHDCFHTNSLTGSTYKKGYVRPYESTLGPVIEKPVQGTCPGIAGVLTLPNGERWNATKIGRVVHYSHCYSVETGTYDRLPAGHAFTPDES
jgi:hypothetical protein